MTDGSQWVPPASPEPTQQAPAFPAPGTPAPGASFPPPAAPAFPPPAGPGFAPPAPPAAPFGAPVAPTVQSGWTPPPKPGLVPLRPLGLGAILGASFQVLRRNPRPTFGFSLALNGVIGLLSLGVLGLVAVLAFNRLSFASNNDVDTIGAGVAAQAIVAFIVALLLGVVSAAVLQGVISLEVARGTLGERLRLGGLWRQAKGRMGALIGWAFLLIGVVLVVGVAIALVAALLVGLGGQAGIAIAVLLTIVAAIGFTVLSVWIGTKLAFVPSALMIERLSLRAAIGRSWSLTGGFFWRVLGIQLLVAVILNFASQIVTTPVSFVGGLALGILNPNGDTDAVIVTTIITYAVLMVLAVVVQAITSVVQAATSALLYIDLRIRKEGLDLELTRFVEARQSGENSQPDPYLQRPAAATAAQPTLNGVSWT